jgi:hypothetical protein
MVQQKLFDFVTGVLRSGATVRTYETGRGYMTTYSVQGDEFMAHYPSMENYVNRNKREAATIYLNRLIDLGVVIMHDDMITTGPNLEH